MKTPVAHDNRPRLAVLRYRVGSYADFRESMLARLSDPDPFAALQALRTLDPDDPTVALLDAFAAVGAILTFYQERLANEGFLRTATMRSSLRELARLTAYQPRPGIAASVHLSFTLDAGATLTLPAGTRAQSVPGPGQTPQSFETDADFLAKGLWNAMPPRLSRPTQPGPALGRLFVDGTTTGLNPNDPLLVIWSGTPQLRRVAKVEPQFDRQRTVITLRDPPKAADPGPGTPAATPPSPGAPGAAGPSAAATVTPTPTLTPTPTPAPSAPSLVTDQVEVLAALATRPPATHPRNAQALVRSANELFAPQAEAALSLTAGVSTAQRSAVFRALAGTKLGADRPALEVHAFRAITAPFGNRAPPPVVLDPNGQLLPPQEWTLADPVLGNATRFTIDIDTQTEAPSDVLRSRAFAAAAQQQDIIASIAFGDTARLVLTLRPGAQSVTDTLPEELGAVTMTLVRAQTSPDILIELDFAFSLQPLTLALQKVGRGPMRVANLHASAAGVTVSVTEDPLRITGTLRPVTGSQFTEQPKILCLDGSFDAITPDTWVAFDAPAGAPLPMQVASAASITRVGYGQTARTTQLTLRKDWIDPPNTTFAAAVRNLSVYADSIPLTLADEDVTDPVPQTAHNPTLELDGLFPGLAAGRWLIVTGERIDLPGVTAAELVMLAGVEHSAETAGGSVAPGETAHTVLTFASPLAYTYLRPTVQVLGNVAPATQGESVDEILGSGDGAAANQAFTLKKPPVTFVPSPNAAGFASTLRIWVNSIEWHEVDTLAGQSPDACVFETATGDDGSVTVRHGDGTQGARLPTGAENIRARYRSGSGLSGNVDAGTITNLLSRPLGLTGVTNPLAATGGADPETPDQIRRNAPLGLVGLQRLVSVQDYEDFALARPGIAKAAVARFDGPDGPLVHLTLAGAADDALDPTGALWTTLIAALQHFGDPPQAFDVAPRAARLAVIGAGVTVCPDRQWSDVEPVVRAKLTAAFGFDRRELGQTLHRSDVITAIQTVPGVSHVDLTLLAAVPQPCTVDQLQAAITAGRTHDLPAHPARVDPARVRPRRILPAELVYLSDALPDMLVLNEVKP